MIEPSAQQFLDLACRLARSSGETARARIGSATVSRKADNSVVTDADHAIQADIVNAIAVSFPDHAIVAEETLEAVPTRASVTSARYCWIIDPLDGTRNYAAGFPCYSTSIAVLDRGEPLIGVVAEHNVNQVYAAIRGCGTTVNGVPAHVLEPDAGEDFLVGLPSSKDRLTASVATRWVSSPGFICRNVGSTAFHLAMVANGALAGAFAKRAKLWDVAAGALLITEAGGCYTDLTGAPVPRFSLSGDPNDDVPFVAGAPRLHKRLIESVRSCGSP